ncbi:hypothetical protein DOTSEDRAFT_146104 [Dothistroma septosporum NZE10]|uniref:Urease accessory protein UreD n=1 Tax=Dothistroma septosporum (strain NZE10 / CBS 128990) TaxID=675120 RepID=N1PWS7_DOTSN|nr:hypothetical protein DOTSEDRAFT_146104 [Dothistroma septosporum NZE10]
MPHKHTRRQAGDKNNFDLAPSQVAKPLAAFGKSEKHAPKGQKAPESGRKRKRTGTRDDRQDDTPRAFARLMQLRDGRKQRSGLDDGESRKTKKKRKTGDTSQDEPDITQKTLPVDPRTGEQLKILPGEKLADFAARVNQALPLGGLTRKGKHKDGSKERQTMTEKRLHRMYAEWREEEAKRKEKLEELQEKQEEEDEEKQAEYGGQRIELPESGRKAKRKRMVGEVDDAEDDPWAVLNTRREAPKGLNDVVQAPPTLKVIPKEKFKVRNGANVDVANVPGAAGSLKRREELGEARKEVIERYRAMMKSGRHDQ